MTTNSPENDAQPTRSRIKCPSCQLVQWRGESCLKCGYQMDQVGPSPSVAPPQSWPPGPEDLPRITPNSLDILRSSGVYMEVVAIINYFLTFLYGLVSLGALIFFAKDTSASPLFLGFVLYAALASISWFVASLTSKSRKAILEMDQEDGDSALALERFLFHHKALWKLSAWAISVGLALGFLIAMLAVLM